MKFTLTNESITVIQGGKSHVVRSGEVNFQSLKCALMAENWEEAGKCLTVKAAVEAWSTDNQFTVSNNKVTRNGEELPDSVSVRILSMVKTGEDPKPMLKFWDRLNLNPSWRSVQQLWGFMANKGIPVDQDGCILAYKAVNNNWKDCHTNTIDNSVGTVHEMARNKISDDAAQACHYGFHVGALGYAESFGPSDRRMIICKVDPMDVVCVPNDSSQQKMRVCKYEVIGVHSGRLMPSTVYNTKSDKAVKKPTEVNSEPIVGTKTRKVRSDAGKPRGPRGGPVVKTPHRFDNFDSLQLMEQTSKDLLEYASGSLRIVGASKIAGGKTAIIVAIDKARG